MFGAGLEGDFSPCLRPAARDVPESHPGLGACRAGASLFPHRAPPRGEKICRIMSDLQFNMAAAANVVGARSAEQTGGHACSRPAVPAQGGGMGRVERGRGRTGGREGGRTPRQGQRRRIILFPFGGVNYTRSDSGRRELKRSGFVSVNCLEASLFFTLAWRARVGGRAGEMPGSGAGGSAGPGGRSRPRERSGGSFSWSDGGL